MTRSRALTPARARARAQRAALLAALTAASLGAAFAVSSCRGNSAAIDAPDAATSPQASAVPAALATTPATANSPLPSGYDAGPPPETLRGDRAVPADGVSDRPFVGFTMEAVLHPVDFAPPPRSGELNVPLEDALRKQGEPRITLDFSTNRARIRFVSGAFSLPAGTEARSRSDRFGHLLFAPASGPDPSHYAVLPPDTLHALLDDRRLDVGPTLGAETSPHDGAGRRLGIVTHRVEVVTGAGRASIEFGHLDASGEAGTLLTRFLLEMIDAPPSSVAQPLDEIPLRAELHIAPRGSLVFEATSLAKNPELAATDLLTPPPASELSSSPFPDAPAGLLVTKEDLATLRSASLAMTGDGADSGAATGFGLSLFNATDRLRFAALDGIPVAWLTPGARINVPAPRGHWFLQWRTFFGDEVSSAEPVALPAIRTIGDADAGLGHAP